MLNKKFIISVLNILTLCVIIGGVSIFFVENDSLIGLVLIILGIFCLVSLIPFKVKIRSVQPDVFFGIIDNGILAIFSLIGGRFGGVAGAIIGGVVGNAITDGLAGIFEGYYAEKLRSQLMSEERTMLKSAVGKMSGCLLGAGAVLLFADFIHFFR